ncbi:MAG: PmoA family protein [Bacteroidales bacterium]|jgi:hypothetical protein|nr:PmoA family protein [Bacteroidales bacterium]
MMKILSLILTAFLVQFLPVPVNGQESLTPGKTEVAFLVNEVEKKVSVMVGGGVVTSLCWPDNVYKPVLYPVHTLSGTEITRGFPLNPRAGERNDHIHQVGLWFNYGNVNGFDFWGNGSTGKKSENGGVIVLTDIRKAEGGEGRGVLAIKALWQDPSGNDLVEETTEFHFIAGEDHWIVDRLTTLKALDKDVSMKDTKEGMFAMRVARQLELPSKDNVALLASDGKTGTEKALGNRGVTGNYRSSEGITGEAVWGKRAKWMCLSGSVNDEKVSVVICDHPDNPSYPTYWHARGYGLFSANPLGAADFTDGKETVNFSIPAGGHATFRYRTIIASGSYLSDDEINRQASDFSELY